MGCKHVFSPANLLELTKIHFLGRKTTKFHSIKPIFETTVSRDKDFAVCQFGEVGILQLVSPLATSYPGHNILSEDSGVIIGEDDCSCGKNGKYFNIHGRLKDADVRGCSDAYVER